MPEYVKREAATQAAVRAVWLGQTSAGQIAKAINDVPAADVMEVTRCKDCKHYRIFLKRDMCAKNAQVLDGHEVGLTATNPDNFCSYGERKSG